MTRDLLWALRWLRKNPLFTVAVVVILGLGIGAVTAVFSLVDAVLLRPGPYVSPATLVKLEAINTKRPPGNLRGEDYLLWSGRRDLFAKIGAHLRDDVTITGAGDPDQVIARRVTGEVFPLLGVQPRLGRGLTEADAKPGAPNVAVLSDRLWRRMFHADPNVVGRAFTIQDEPYTVAGVMAPDFEFPYPDVAMWIPLRLNPAAPRPVQGVIARLREDVSLSRAQAAMDLVAAEMARDDPQSNDGLRIAISPWRDNPGKKYEQTLVAVLAAVGLVLLLACANVASLMLSRALQRREEIAIRASLGAGVWRVARQLLTESIVLAAAGSTAGIVVGYYTLRFLTRQLAALPVALPHIQQVMLNERVLSLNILLCVVLAFLFSLAPVFLASRMDLQTVLRSGDRSGGRRGSTRLFSMLIAGEAAFAFLLLATSGLMIRSLIRLQSADHGIHVENVLTLRVPIGSLTQTQPLGKYDTKPRQMAYYRELLARIQVVPGVQAAAVVNNLPLSGVNTTTAHKFPDGQTRGTPTRTISPAYFSVMGTPLIAGRFFTDADNAAGRPVAIINEYLARHLFPDREAIGQVLVEPNTANPRTIVGVVRNAPQMSYEAPPKEEVYLPYQQVIFGIFLSTIVVRTSGDPLALTSALRREVWAVDPAQPVVKVETMDSIIANSIWRPRFSAWIFSVLGGLALVLTAAGVYSVVAYTATLRTREVGIRVALGATPRDVMTMVMRSVIIPLTIGLAISIVAAILLSRLLGSLLYQMSATDPLTYTGAAVLLLAIGAVASARPAWRAATGDPLQALRTE